MNGKGDTRRPATVLASEMQRRWEATFGVVSPSPSPNANGDWVAVVEPTERVA